MFWLKITPESGCPIATGPFETSEDATTAKAEFESPPEGDAPTDTLEVVEGDADYPKTLKVETGKTVINDEEYLVFSDDSLELAT